MARQVVGVTLRPKDCERTCCIGRIVIELLISEANLNVYYQLVRLSTKYRVLYHAYLESLRR